MVERWLIIWALWILFSSAASSQEKEEAAEFVVKSKYEIGLTPGFSYFYTNNDSSLGIDKIYWLQLAPRLQIGKEVYNSIYATLFYNWMARHTNNSEYFGDEFVGYKFGLQLSYKFYKSYIEQPLFMKNNRMRYLKLYPEAMMATGLSNLSSIRYFEDLRSGRTLYSFYEFAAGLNIVLGSIVNLQVVQAVSINPGEKHAPYAKVFVIRLIIKL